MKVKLSLIVFLLFGLFLSSSAQNFLINENFSSGNDTVPPTGWTNKMLSGDATYDKFQFTSKVFNFARPLVKNFVVFDAYNGGSAGGTATNNLGEEVVLISPIVNTSSLSNLTLSLDKQLFIQAGAEAYIEVSTNGGTSWTSVFSQTAAVVEGTPSNLTINLNSYTGYKSFQIRFKWYNATTTTYRGFFAFDNVQLYESKSIDVRVKDIVEMYDNSCPSATQSLNVIVYNAGTSTQTNVPVVLKIGSTTIYDTIKSIASGASVSSFTTKTFNAASGGNFQFVCYTNLSSDLVKANDTLKTVRSSSPPPAVPTGGSVSQCGVGSSTLTTNKNNGDSTYWFLQATGGSDVGAGNPYITPYLDKTTTFYVENSRVNQSEITSSAGLYRFNGAIQPGSFFNLTSKSDVLIDSFGQHFAYNGNYTMSVYYRTGTYQGYESSSGSWTKLDLVKDTINVNGYGKFYVVRLKKTLRVPTGSTYSFYIHASASSITFTNGTMDEENADVRITGNTVTSASFNGITTGYYWNGRVFYRKTCSTGRKAIVVNLLPRPKGVKLIEGSVFNGNYRSGTITNFDVAAVKRTISYELEPPTGYTNAEFGSKWAITGLDMSTVNGTPIPTKDTTSSVPGSTNGKLSYTPSAGWEDSLIVIKLLVWDSKTNCDTLIERFIFIAPAPKVLFEAPNVCLGTSIAFVNKSTISSGFLTYFWELGDGNTSTFESPIHTYANYGKLYVKLTATSNYGISSDTIIDLEVYEIPNIKFTVVNACENVPLKFNNATTISSGSLAFSWNFGDGIKSTAINPTHKYLNAGGYKVTLTASANGCDNSLTKFATQFPRPKSDFNSDGGCQGQEISFNNGSTIGLGEKSGSVWNFDDGNIGTLTHPKHKFSTAGTKQVKLVSVSQFGCKDSITKAVIIKPSPVVDFSYDRNCNAEPVNFTNLTKEPTGATTIYSWSFGDGSTSTQQNPSHKYNDLGRQYILLTALSNNGCSGEAIKEINVLVQPVADFEVKDIVCSGEPVQFTNHTRISKGDIKYKWYFGDGDSSDFVSPTKVYDVNSSTIFVIKLEASALGGCTDIVTRNVTVSEKPECGFTVVQSKVDRRTFTFVPNNSTYGDAAYTWVLKGSGVYNTTSPTHTFEYYDNAYEVILDVKNNGGCSCYDSTNIVTTSWSLSAEDFAVKGLEIYPNPTTGMVTIKNSSQPQEALITINVYGFDGKLVAHYDEINSSSDGSLIDLGHLSSGVYNIEVISNASKSSQKLVIAR